MNPIKCAFGIIRGKFHGFLSKKKSKSGHKKNQGHHKIFTPKNKIESQSKVIDFKFMKKNKGVYPFDYIK